MIALRGKLERTIAASSETASNAATATTWKWKGRWAFGKQLPDDDATITATAASTAAITSKTLPFEYTWSVAVDPSTIAVPSAQENEEEAALSVNTSETHESLHTKTLDTTASDAAKPAQKEEEKKAKEAKIGIEEAAKKDAEKEQGDKASVPTAETTTPTKDDKTDATTVSTNITITTPSKKIVTFATKSTFDDPFFTEAASKHPDKCPVSGKFDGYFETVGARKNTTARVQETFYLFLNATPSATAQSAFPAHDNDDLVDEAYKLKEGHVHARGTGENQYGTFELLGQFCVETGVLECQRMYVKTAASPTRSRSSNKSGSSRKVSSGERSYQTRKRQLSWKRRAAMEESDDDKSQRSRAATASGGTGATRPQQQHQQQSRKRARIDSVASLSVVDPTSLMPLSAAPLSIDLAGLTTGAAIASSVAKRPPSLSPHQGASSNPTSAVGYASAKRVSTATSSRTVSTGPGLKLPAAGIPVQARWRAAHFLYYQRNDPSIDEGSSTGTGNTNGITNSSSVPPKYVVYEGDLLHSQRDGRGICLYNNGLIYEGEWKRNKEHGQGVLITATRKHIIYKGEWERGRMHGIGTYYYLTSNRNKPPGGGSRYEGDWKENLRHGTGTYVLPDGSVYVGQWREGAMSGRGVFTWPDGAVYDGEWKDGKRHGQGLLKTADGFTYDGTWSHNSMEGRGSATYPNGQQYNGLFSNGRREGRGTILFPNGAVYEGRFRDDAVDGQGTMKMSRTMVVPRTEASMTIEEEGSEKEEEKELKDDFMIPLYFQSDIGHIHRKAGFTIVGE